MKEIIDYLKELYIEYEVFSDTQLQYAGFYYWFSISQSMIDSKGVESIKRSIYNNQQH